MIEFISEIGINHNGSFSIAKKLIQQSKIAGAQFVKFQIRDLNEIYNKKFLKNFQNSETANQYIYNQLKKNHIKNSDYIELFKYSRRLNLKVMLTPFDLLSVKLCKNNLVNAIKVGSPDFENLDLIKKILELKKPIFFSTGMSNEDEIKKVYKFIIKNNINKNQISFLHCVSSYPPREDELNLKYMKSLKNIIKPNTLGYSGHERGIDASLLSIFYGAKVIERHITLDKNMKGPDHNSSITLNEFKKLTELGKHAYNYLKNKNITLDTYSKKFKIKDTKIIIGKNKKIISNNALFNKKILGKSYIFKSNCKKNTKLDLKQIKLVSPGKGIGPLQINKYLGKKLRYNVKKNEYVSEDNFKKNKNKILKINRNWGVVGRLGDFEQFIYDKADLIEIHLTWRELLNPKLPNKNFNKELIVHAPEYFQDKLIDFTTNDKNILNNSFEMMENIENLIDKIKNNFYFDEKKGPKLVLHPGGHSENPKNTLSKIQRYKNLNKNINKLKNKNYNLLIENMPPYPWYYGGRYYQHIFTDTNEIYNFCKETNTKICYDTSHAKLSSNLLKREFIDFSRKILKYTEYLHISDAKGTDGEGLQIGDGEINFKEFFKLAKNNNASFIPEIWNGHLDDGKGFKKALEKLELITKKISVTHKHK